MNCKAVFAEVPLSYPKSPLMSANCGSCFAARTLVATACAFTPQSPPLTHWNVSVAFAGMVQISGVAVGTAVLWTSVASLLAIVAVGGLRKGWGFYAGWLAQALAVALGGLTPWMYAMGIVFALIWTTSFVLGKRLEHRNEKAEQ